VQILIVNDFLTRQHQPFKRLFISYREGNEASRRANQAFGFKYIGKEDIDWPDDVKGTGLSIRA